MDGPDPRPALGGWTRPTSSSGTESGKRSQEAEEEEELRNAAASNCAVGLRLCKPRPYFGEGGGGYGLTPEIVTNFLLYTCHVVLFIGLSVSIIFAKLFAVN